MEDVVVVEDILQEIGVQPDDRAGVLILRLCLLACHYLLRGLLHPLLQLLAVEELVAADIIHR